MNNSNLNNNEFLEKIHEVHLEMLKKIDSVCKEHKINYCLAFGSALGAVRHNGFIPWDDDADIVMKLSDYIKFKDILNRACSKEYFLQDPMAEKESPFVFAKMRKNNTFVLDETAKGLNMHEGIWIDIFILIDGCKSSVGLKIQDFLARIFQTLRCKYRYINDKSGYKANIIKRLLYRLPDSIKVFFEKTIFNLLKLIGSSQSDYYYMLSNTGVERSSFKKGWYNESCYQKFEDTSLLIPEDYDDYLKSLYGEYMKPVEYSGHIDKNSVIFNLNEA